MPTPMSPSATARDAYFDALVREYQPNRPLPGAFYTSADVFAVDVERIFRRWWMFAGHACAIPKPGDWFTCKIAGDWCWRPPPPHTSFHGAPTNT